MAAARGRLVPEAEVANRPIQVPADGYTSSRACQACHPSQYASWHRSYHRTMTQVATPQTVAARFDDVLEERDGELWTSSGLSGLTEVRPGPDRGQTAGERRRVVMTTGSHHQQIFWYATGNSRVLDRKSVV